jgi:hypothetical protein
MARVLATIVLFVFAVHATGGEPLAVNAAPSILQCNGHLLPDYVDRSPWDDGNHEGVSDLYVGAHRTVHNYLTQATFTLPRTPQRKGFYGNGIRLGPLKEDYAFIQVMLVRERRFDFADHVAVAWALPYSSKVVFKDTNLLYRDNDPSHRLGIRVIGGALTLYVDGSVLCTARSDHFVRSGSAKYFQIRTETDVPGFFGSGTVRDIALKTDAEKAPRPFRSDCEFHGYGVSWIALGRGAYRSQAITMPTKRRISVALVRRRNVLASRASRPAPPVNMPLHFFGARLRESRSSLHCVLLPSGLGRLRSGPPRRWAAVAEPDLDFLN